MFEMSFCFINIHIDRIELSAIRDKPQESINSYLIISTTEREKQLWNF